MSNEANAKLAVADQEWRDARAELELLRARLNSIEHSTIWRATHPLRWIGLRMPFGLRQAARRTLRLVWWALSLQLLRRIKEHLARPRTLMAQEKAGTAVVAEAASPLTLPASSDWRDALKVAEPVGARPAPCLPRPDSPRALIIDFRWPRPDRDSGSLDAVHQVRALRRFGYEIIFAGDTEFHEKTPYRDALESEGVRCLTSEICSSVEGFLHSDGDVIDLVVLSRVYWGGRYLEIARRHAPRARVVFNTVDLHHLREEREARMFGDSVALRRAEEIREREFYIACKADATIVVSAEERAMLERNVPGAAVFEMPLARAVREWSAIPGFEPRHGVGFVGGFEHMPNVDAVRFLVSEIWPLVLRRRPWLDLTIVGAGLPPEVLSMAPRGVRYLGPLMTLEPWLDGLRLTVAPLRYGAGAKGKVASSLASGVPCVSTPIAAEGMRLAGGVEIVVAESADAIAAKICEVHDDAVLWRRLSESGHLKAIREMSLEAGEERLGNMLHAIGAPCPRKT